MNETPEYVLYALAAVAVGGLLYDVVEAALRRRAARRKLQLPARDSTMLTDFRRLP